MEFHGIPWNSMEFHGILWYTMENHLTRTPMEYNEILELHGAVVPWYPMEFK